MNTNILNDICTVWACTFSGALVANIAVYVSQILPSPNEIIFDIAMVLVPVSALTINAYRMNEGSKNDNKSM